jgi:CheY-like chemotaxis protein
MTVPPSVLVIEDDPDIRESVVALIETETPWVRVTSAGDGLEALELIQDAGAPCLALLDIMMPVMNGLEFLDALRERGLGADMHVVLVSGYVELAKHVQYPGVTGLLPKPFRAADLLAVVRRHCPDPSSTGSSAPG